MPFTVTQKRLRIQGMISVGVATKISHHHRFTSREQEVIVPVLLTIAVLLELFGRLFRDYGWTMSVYQLLRISGWVPHRILTFGMIRDLRINRVPGATRLIDRLKKRSLVRRRRSAPNHRQVAVTISDQELSLVDRREAESRDPHRVALQNLSISEI